MSSDTNSRTAVETDDPDTEGVENAATESAAPHNDGADPAGSAPSASRLEQEGEIAADYLEGLLDIADLDGDIDMDVEGNRASVSVVGADLSQLVGQKGEVLEALQELTRLAVQATTGDRSRLMLDVSGYRERRREELQEVAAAAIRQINEGADKVSLSPMSPFERKVVHDAVAAAGLQSESEGVEPQRFVVVLPA